MVTGFIIFVTSPIEATQVTLDIQAIPVIQATQVLQVIHRALLAPKMLKSININRC